MSESFSRKAIGAFCALSTMVLLSGAIGCGIGANNVATSPLIVPAMTGKDMGGQVPIQGATVKIYATTSSGYGVGSLLQEATQQGTSAGEDTDSGGAFSFAGGYTCPAGQFAYLVSSGGNTGANAVNPNSVMVAALGRCEDLYARTRSPIFINELTTIAAAYALGNFSKVTGTGGATVVQIGADATNNAAQVGGVSTGCVAGTGSCTTTAAAGLAHAFLNANNLVDPFSNTAVTGASATLPNGAVLPQQLIDSIGNILVACVNSTGGTAGDSSACGQIFSATTIGLNVPVNTFSAMVNLAADPTLGGSGAAVVSLFNVAAPATSVYSPALASATGLNDFSIAINYPATAFPAISFPMSGALDINDNYYVGNATYNTGSPGNPTAPVNILSFSSDGLTYGASAQNTTEKAAYGLSVDALSNGYTADGGGSGTNALGIFQFNDGVTATTALTTGGIVTAAHSGNLKTYALAVDQANNVWALGLQQSNGTSNLYMNPGAYVSGAKTWVAQPSPTVTLPAANFIGLAIDPNQNVWTTASTELNVVENSGSVGAPTYTAVTGTATTGGSPAVGVTFAPAGASYKAWVSSYDTTPGVEGFTPTFDTNAIGVSSVTSSGLVTPASLIGSLFNEADGAGNIWVADTNSASVQQFIPANSTAYKLLPCAGGSTTCASAFTSPGKPLDLSVDSAGSIWVVVAAEGSTNATATPGNVVQIIGSAAPTWPLLSLGKLGQP